MDENNLGNTGYTVLQDDNLSDVIEVIQTDTDFRESTAQNITMFNGGGEISQQQSAGQPQQSTQQSKRQQPYVRIIEQPASKALRFRYECEGRSAGSIPGVSSTPENKTFPAIKVEHYHGRAVVVVSCVTKDPPYRPHPHNLVGREGCKKGVCTLEIPTDTMTIHFSNLGIQCVKKKDIEHALRTREEIRVDPFRTGFSHRNHATSIDLNAVRLCFQVFLDGDTPGKFSVPLAPVVSEPIYDKKAMSDLIICKMSDCVSYVDGGRKDILLFCEKVAKEDIQIRFFEKDGDWEGFADVQPSQVHKQYGIAFRTPRYKTLDVTEPVKVFIQLRRPSDGATSEPLPFEFLPLDSEPGMLKRKRKKIEDPSLILKHLQGANNAGQMPLNVMNIVKPEPRDTTPSPYESFTPYSGISPGYVPNMSPQSYLGLTPTPTPQECSFNIPINNPNLPSTSSQPQIWNNSTIRTPLSTSNPPNTAWNILDLDSQVNMNSDEINAALQQMGVETTLPEIGNLSFSDVTPNQDHNMTDSLTRLANTMIDDIYKT